MSKYYTDDTFMWENKMVGCPEEDYDRVPREERWNDDPLVWRITQQAGRKAPSTADLTKPYKEHDNVEKPSHYNTGNIECIEAIEEALTDKEIRGYFKGNCLKYLWREQYKNGLEDLKKARWYLDRLIKRLEKE